MRDVVDDIRQRGAELFVIGNGSPAQALDFQKDRGRGLNLLVDPSLKTYAAAGLRRNPLSMISPRSIGHSMRALAKGKIQGLTQGDPWQLGGAFVVDPQGQVVFRQVSREAGDHADPVEILAALDRLAQASL